MCRQGGGRGCKTAFRDINMQYVTVHLCLVLAQLSFKKVKYQQSTSQKRGEPCAKLGKRQETPPWFGLMLREYRWVPVQAS